MPDAHVDVCVIGAGPAGSAVAQRLASLGHSVLIAEACAFPRPHLGETLAGSVWPLLEVLGARDAVESAGFLRPTGTLLRWAGPTEWRAATAGSGLQVDRSRFDTILLNAARAAGARVIQPARVVRMSRDGGRWRAIAHTGAGTLTISSRLVVDAAGRSGCLGGRKQRHGPRTLALAAYWNGYAQCPSETCGPETRVEAGEDQWFWGAPLPDGRMVAAAFVDAAAYRRGIHRFGGKERFYEHLLAHAELLRGCLRRTRATAVHVCDASPCEDAEPATADAIKVGEAGFAIDPLSSQGVQTAIGSAMHAAAVAHTILTRPDDTAAAIEFYAAAQKRAVAFHRRAAANAYAEAAATRVTPFWRERSGASAGTLQQPATRPAPLTCDRVVQLAGNVRLETAPMLRGDVIALGRQVVLPGDRAPVAFLDGVELAPLLDGMRNPVRVREVVDAWGSRMPPDRAVAILDWLWTNGALGVMSDSLDAADIDVGAAGLGLRAELMPGGPERTGV